MSDSDTDDLMVWIDLETTGLNPVEDLILEVGFRITNWDGSDEVARFTSLVHSPGWRERLHLGDNRPAHDIHQANGLVAELTEFNKFRDTGVYVLPDVRETESLVLAWLDSYHVPNGLPLAGSSNHLDRYFLLRHMPELANRFTYRLQDVSVLREFMRVTTPELVRRLDETFTKESSKHRVQSDIDDSIRMYQWIIDNYLMT